MESASPTYRDLSEFLSKHITKPDEQCTHTRIPDKALNIYPGSYHIPKKELSTFYPLYYQHVFIKKKPEYLTEKQLENGPLLIDLDFHYSHNITKRQHTDENVQDLISIVYLEILKEFLVFQVNDSFDIHVMHKPNVNRLKDESMTKDGIHFNFCLQMDHIMQQMLRDRVLAKIQEVLDLPLINGWDKVLDEGISKGCTNWQMLGSRKPNNEAYAITQSYRLTYCEDGEFTMEEVTESNSLSEDFAKFSAQYEDHPKFEINTKIKEEYERRKNVRGNLKARKESNKTRIVSKKNAQNCAQNEEFIAYEDIKNQEILSKAMDQILSRLSQSDQELKTYHNLVQILPEKYYEPGSHELNRKVAFALKDADDQDRLFLSWIMLRSKASDFDYDTIPDLYTKWDKYFKIKQDGITKQSIMFWAKTDAPEEFNKIQETNMDYYMDISLKNQTHYDFAFVLFLMFKDTFICSELGKSGNSVWYLYEHHRWKLDEGQQLKLIISEEMYMLFSSKLQKRMDYMQDYDPDDERYIKGQKNAIQMSQVINRLKDSNYKSCILREAASIFYNYRPGLNEKMDTNKNLMSFTNGVIDFERKIFRDGSPDDFITKSTGIPYVDVSDPSKLSEEQLLTMKEVNDCLNQIFPVVELRNYVLDHLASTLIGQNINQTFNIYYGSGRNGKSVITDLMSQALGEYKGIVPISMITEKRAGVGGLSPEVIALKGVRYAVIQEPEKSMKLNEGFMKELTGGDTITARTLFSKPESYVPQYDVVVCANNLFEIASNDDGTWRRIRVINFMAKFLFPHEWDSPEFDDCKFKFPRYELKHMYARWAPLFAGMLIQRVFKTGGLVTDCSIVLEASKNYRREQDHISGFVNERIEKQLGKTMRKKELYEEFKLWFELQNGSAKKPKGTELYEYMNKRFKRRGDGWQDVGFIYPDVDEMDEMTNA